MCASSEHLQAIFRSLGRLARLYSVNCIRITHMRGVSLISNVQPSLPRTAVYASVRAQTQSN